MTRDTGIRIDQDALRHNLKKIQEFSSNKPIIAMVKANAYGCGVENVVPVISDNVYALGVACLGEALFIRQLGIQRECILFEGVFDAEELRIASQKNMHIVVHTSWQLRLLLQTPLSQPVTVWVKFDSGMHRLGFQPQEVFNVCEQLHSCPWVLPRLGLMSHFSCADVPGHPLNAQQLACFNTVLSSLRGEYLPSMANSAAIISNKAAHFEVIRPGIMLYGVSPFENQTAEQFDLRPVMHFHARIMDIHAFSANQPIGYGATWYTRRPTRIGVVTAGYGDGYPRHIQEGTLVEVSGQFAPIVGRISMDLMTIDISDCQNIEPGDSVELWGKNISVEYVASQAGTIAYELLCQQKARKVSFP